MDEIKQMIEDLVVKMKSTQEYNQYQSLLGRVKAQPDLYRRIGEYRRRSLWVQMKDGEDFISENNNLQNEFQDLQNNGLANEFLAAEHQYCGMVKQIQNQFLEGVEIDTSFIEE